MGAPVRSMKAPARRPRPSRIWATRSPRSPRTCTPPPTASWSCWPDQRLRRRCPDRLGGWKSDGHRTCAHWLAWRTGIDLGAAREKVRAARALEALPLTSASMSRGEISFAKVRALTRVATAANEAALLDVARAGTAAHLERVVRAWRWLGTEAEAEREEARHRARAFSIAVDPDGMYVVRGRLEPEVGALR